MLAGRKKGVQGAKCQDNAQESAQEKFKTGKSESADSLSINCGAEALGRYAMQTVVS